MLGFFCGKIFLWEALVWSAVRKVFWKWEETFFLSVLSASHPNTPNPSFSPKEGLSLVFFFYRGIGFPETALAPESLGKKSIRGN